MSTLKDGINKISNTDYHAERERLSSSNLKMLLKDPAEFYDQKILGNSVQKTSTAFDEGSLVHGMILEPEILDQEFAFFEGWSKRGKEYKAFKELNQNKTIISMPQKHRCETWVRAYHQNELAVKLHESGEPEQTLCGDLMGVKLKARFDWINVEKGYLADLKTSSFPIDCDSFRSTVDRWDYALSAALYLKLAEQYYKKKFDFYFVAIGKQDNDCEVYKLSDETRHLGDVRVIKALKLFKQCKDSGKWESIEKDNEIKKHEILEV